jgi:hypothetical protein
MVSVVELTVHFVWLHEGCPNQKAVTFWCSGSEELDLTLATVVNSSQRRHILAAYPNCSLVKEAASAE